MNPSDGSAMMNEVRSRQEESRNAGCLLRCRYFLRMCLTASFLAVCFCGLCSPFAIRSTIL